MIGNDSQFFLSLFITHFHLFTLFKKKRCKQVNQLAITKLVLYVEVKLLIDVCVKSTN